MPNKFSVYDEINAMLLCGPTGDTFVEAMVNFAVFLKS